MYTSTFIRRHILRLPKGAIFSTREMLNYGRRSAVDQCLYRLVKIGRIIRLAWGLFMKDDYGTMPSALQVAKEKARAFGKQILTDALDAAKHLRLAALGNKRITYAVQGHSSSFKYGATKIYFKGICARKMLLGDDRVGSAIKALWVGGKKHCNQHAIAKATAQFNQSERRQFRQSCPLMPFWMTNVFVR